MNVIVFAVLLFGVAADQFHWESCTKDTSTPALRIISADLSPMPVVLPGPLTVSFSVEVLKKIDAALLEFDYVKALLGRFASVPCLADFGSCSVDACSLVYNMIHGQRQGRRDLGKQVLQMFASVGIPTCCPIQEQNITVTNFSFQLPVPDKILSYFIYGNYNVTVTAKEPSTGTELGCLRFWISLHEKQTTGFLFGRRRRR